MTIPEIRKRLIEIGQSYGDQEIIDLANELTRRQFGRAAPRSQPMTSAVAASIRAMHQANPDRPLADIARAHNVNPGRVSEVLHGMRQ